MPNADNIAAHAGYSAGHGYGYSSAPTRHALRKFAQQPAINARITTSFTTPAYHSIAYMPTQRTSQTPPDTDRSGHRSGARGLGVSQQPKQLDAHALGVVSQAVLCCAVFVLLYLRVCEGAMAVIADMVMPTDPIFENPQRA